MDLGGVPYIFQLERDDDTRDDPNFDVKYAIVIQKAATSNHQETTRIFFPGQIVMV